MLQFEQFKFEQFKFVCTEGYMQPQSFLYLIRSLIDDYDEYMKSACRELNIPQTSLAILLFLANNPDTPTAKDIVRLRAIKANLVSLHVAKLVHDGYLERKSISGDRRKILLSCTPKASDIIKRGREYQSKFIESITKGLSDAELSSTKACICRLLENAVDLTPPASNAL